MDSATASLPNVVGLLVYGGLLGHVNRPTAELPGSALYWQNAMNHEMRSAAEDCAEPWQCDIDFIRPSY